MSRRISVRGTPARRTGSWRSRWALSEMAPQFERRASVAAGQINQAFNLPTGQRVTVTAVVSSLQTQGCDVTNKRAQRRISMSQAVSAARDAAVYNHAVYHAHETRAAVSRLKRSTVCPSVSEDVFGELAALQGGSSFSEEVFSELAALQSRR